MNETARAQVRAARSGADAGSKHVLDYLHFQAGEFVYLARCQHAVIHGDERTVWRAESPTWHRGKLRDLLVPHMIQSEQRVAHFMSRNIRVVAARPCRAQVYPGVAP